MAAQQLATCIDHDRGQKAKFCYALSKLSDLLSVVFTRVVRIGADCLEVYELEPATWHF